MAERSVLVGQYFDNGYPLEDVIELTRAEYQRAKNKHGNNTPDGATTDINRIATLGEEYGEVCRALTYDQDHAKPLKDELIQVAAMALAWASRLHHLEQVNSKIEFIARGSDRCCEPAIEALRELHPGIEV